MTRRLIASAMTVLLWASAACAQSHPYAAIADRPIKGLSADDIASLRAGRGMGMALPAELNRYPGPLHVLENAAALGFSQEQKEQVQRQFDRMRSEALVLGEGVIAAETALDVLFRSGSADAASVDAATAEVASLYGRLRAVHLRAHLDTRATLNDAQLAAYQQLRGYNASGAAPAHKH